MEKIKSFFNYCTSTFMHLLGQLCVLQFCDCDAVPLQDFPPYCGAGLEQLLVLPWDPPPHVNEHEPHLLQEPYLPSTEIENNSSSYF